MSLRLEWVEPALWLREWQRIRRWLASGRLLNSLLAVLFLAFVLAPLLIVDFTSWETLRQLQQTPSWSFFVILFALITCAFLLALVRSAQVISKEHNGRMLDQFLLAFADAPRIVATVQATGLAQAGVLCGCMLPVLVICALGKESVPGSLLLCALLVLGTYVFLAAALGAVGFFVLHKVLRLRPGSHEGTVGALAWVVVWMTMEEMCRRAATTGTLTDIVARACAASALVLLWHTAHVGWRALARLARMPAWRAECITLLATACAAFWLATTPADVLVAGRLKTMPFFLTPYPYLIGAAMPWQWDSMAINVFGEAPRVVPLLLALALLYLVLGFAALEAARTGYERIWRNPEGLAMKPAVNDDEAPVVHAADTYWHGLRNAVWTLDIRGRLRNRDTATFMTFAAGTTALAGFLPLFMGLELLTDPFRLAEVTSNVFGFVVLTEVALVTFLVPGITSEAIGLEHEHQTIELMLTTALAPREILGGKLLGAISYILLLVSPSLPLFAFCCVFHGALVSQVLQAYVLMLVAAFAWGTLGIAISATQGKNLAGAKYTTYALVLLTAAFPGSPLYLAFYVGNPNGILFGMRLAEMLGLAIFWSMCASVALSAWWAAACFQLGARHGAEW